MTPAPISTVRAVAADIKIAHSVFALPFALFAAFMAVTDAGYSIDWSRFGGQLLLVVLAMFFARTVAMLSNRLLDRRLDALNPRTAGRAIPGGRLAPGAAMTVLLGSAGCFMTVCAAFAVLYGNPWPVMLGLPVLAWISVYPLLKRVTALCHLYLGSSLALSPLAAALAVEPPALAHQPGIFAMSGMVMLWVAGFDVIYALQDIASDRGTGVFSLPARLGSTGALWVSRGLHAVAVALLGVMLVIDERLGGLFAVAVVLVAALLLVEHATVHRWGTARIALAFFTLNGIVSCLLGVCGIADLLIGP